MNNIRKARNIVGVHFGTDIKFYLYDKLPKTDLYRTNSKGKEKWIL